ncbi:MAG: hypothetical protein R3C99_00295 [Pirellulaceae bacterium]
MIAKTDRRFWNCSPRLARQTARRIDPDQLLFEIGELEKLLEEQAKETTPRRQLGAGMANDCCPTICLAKKCYTSCRNQNVFVRTTVSRCKPNPL